MLALELKLLSEMNKNEEVKRKKGGRGREINY